MATYTVAAGELSAQDKVLAASTADTVTFTDQVTTIEVLSDGSAAIYVCPQPGFTAAVGSAHCRKIPAGGPSSLTLRLSGNTQSLTLISSGTPTYSVTVE